MLSFGSYLMLILLKNEGKLKKIWIFNWSIEAYSLLIDEKMQETEMKVSNR